MGSTSSDMEILVIGGTGFIGPHVVRELTRMGHLVTIFHRGSTRPDLPARHIFGNRPDLATLRPRADVVIDLILSTGAQAKALMSTFRGIARRVVVASSMDVYRACGVFHGSEDGPLEPVPLTEDSPLRTKLQTYPAAQVKMLQRVFGWLEDEYDKIPCYNPETRRSIGKRIRLASGGNSATRNGCRWRRPSAGRFPGSANIRPRTSTRANSIMRRKTRRCFPVPRNDILPWPTTLHGCKSPSTGQPSTESTQ